MHNFLDNYFHVSERGSTISREIISGIICFVSMCYIIFVNTSILSTTGMSANALMVTTCLASALGTFLTAFMAGLPLAQAPGLGLNSMMAFTLCAQMGYTWQQALGLVFISGLIFTAIAVSPLRDKFLNAIPKQLKLAISAGIGMFITYIGLINAGIVTANNNLPALSELTGAPFITLIGLAITMILMVYKVNGAILFGILAATVIGIPFGITNTAINFNLQDLSIAPIAFKLSFTGLAAGGIIPLLSVLFTLVLSDFMDTAGTLIGTLTGTNMINEDGSFSDPKASRAILADSIATSAGALLGTSNVTTYIESLSAVENGARTGLSACITGLLFIAAIVLTPLATIVPSCASAVALITVGILLMRNVKDIEWDNLEIAFPAFMTIVLMCLSYSITTGIAFGVISYVIIKLARGKVTEVNPLMYVLALLFLFMFII